MKDYIIDNKTILLPNDPIKLVTLINKNSIRLDKVEEKLELLLDNFIDTTYKHYLILDGEKIEADIAYQFIYKLAKSSVFVIDDYIDIKTLQLLKACNPAVHIIIFSDNKGRNNINRNFIDDFISDTGFTLVFKQNNGRFHDRYIIVDYNTTTVKIFHCGASSKDAGKRITTITKIEETELYDDLIKQLLSHNDLNII